LGFGVWGLGFRCNESPTEPLRAGIGKRGALGCRSGAEGSKKALLSLWRALPHIWLRGCGVTAR